MNSGSSSSLSGTLSNVIFKASLSTVTHAGAHDKSIMLNTFFKKSLLLALIVITSPALIKYDGIGKVKAIELLTSLELGKRVYQEVNETDIINCTNPSNIIKYFNYLFKDKKQEEFYIILLDNKKMPQILCGIFLLSYLDSNQNKQSQNLLCYHYTIAQRQHQIYKILLYWQGAKSFLMHLKAFKVLVEYRLFLAGKELLQE